MLAYDYPLLGVFWSMMIFFLWILWFMLLFRILGDIFRSPDLGGFGKTMWILFVIFLPFLGTLVYVLARGNAMTQRSLDEAKSHQQAFDQYVRSAAATSSSSADELAKFAALRDQGVITDEEFASKKAKLLA
jgi:hypothetical protein